MKEKAGQTGKNETKSIYFRMLLVIGVAIGALAIAGYFGWLLVENSRPDEEAPRSYQYHIAIISYENDTTFWQSVYDSAVQAGRECGAFVEQVGQGLNRELALEEAMEVAIYQGVDGILLRPGDEGVAQSLIDKACERGIPVITMQKDVPRSQRQGFVGINDYFMGQEYGLRIARVATADTHRVMVLFPGEGFNSYSRAWFKQGFTDVLKDWPLHLDFQIIREDNGINNAEDVLQDTFQEGADQPDVIVCLDEVLTQSAYQTVKRLIGPEEIKIIGCYATEDILEGIRQGYIDSTITIDPVELGRKSMEAMMTYLHYGMVSYYTEVDTQLIDSAGGAPAPAEGEGL